MSESVVENVSENCNEDKQLMSPAPTPLILEAKQSMCITDLPIDCLLQVFSKINIRHHNRIRSTCKCLKKAQNEYLRHEFMKAINQFTKGGKNISAAILISIEQATKSYVKLGGYESVLFDCLLPLLRHTYRRPFDLEYQDIKVFKYFLISFFASVDECMRNPGSHFAVMLYLQTILNLIKFFPGCEFTATEKDRKLMINVIVPNIMVTTLRNTCETSGCEKCNAILVILGSLLISTISMRPSYFIQTRYVNELEEENFLFASNVVYGSAEPKTEFKITIEGSERLHSFFKQLMSRSNDPDDDELPDNLSAELIQFEMEIICKSEYHWGCPSKATFLIVPKS